MVVASPGGSCCGVTDETLLTCCEWGVVFGFALTPASDFNRCLISLRPLPFCQLWSEECKVLAGIGETA